MLISASRERSRPFVLPPEELARGRRVGDASATAAWTCRRRAPCPAGSWFADGRVRRAVRRRPRACTCSAGPTAARPRATRPPRAPTRRSSAADAAADATADATAAQPPAGMLLVKRPDGSAWFYVDAQPVTPRDVSRGVRRARAGRHPRRRRSSTSRTRRRRSYALTQGGRLLTDDEWDGRRGHAGVRRRRPACSSGSSRPTRSSKTIRQHGKRRPARTPSRRTSRSARRATPRARTSL